MQVYNRTATTLITMVSCLLSTCQLHVHCSLPGRHRKFLFNEPAFIKTYVTQHNNIIYAYKRIRCVIYNDSNMYIIVREVTNYTNEQLLLLLQLYTIILYNDGWLLKYRILCSLSFDPILSVTLESWAFSIVIRIIVTVIQ